LGERDPAYRTKPRIGVDPVTRAAQEGLPVRAVVADSFAGENETFRTGLAQPGVGDVLAPRPSHAWWALVGAVGSLVDAARAASWDGPEQPGDWQPLVRAFRDGHTAPWWALAVPEPWWALAVPVGPYGPAKRRRAVIATTDPATWPEQTTWRLLTNLPAPAAPRAADTALPAAAVAEVVRLYGPRHWVEQRSTRVKYARGWTASQVRTEHAMRRPWALVCRAFSCCWGAATEAGRRDVTGADAPPASPTGAAPARGETVRRRVRPTAHPPDRERAAGLAPGAGVVGAGDHARPRRARLAGPAATPVAASPARLARAGPSQRAL